MILPTDSSNEPKIITHPERLEAYADDTALASISSQLEAYLLYHQENLLADMGIGFSVEINFIPEEELRKEALALLDLAPANKYLQ